MKIKTGLSLVILALSFSAKAEICGILNRVSYNSKPVTDYVLSYGTTPTDQHAIVLMPWYDEVSQFLKLSYNNSLVCVNGHFDVSHKNVYWVESIRNDNAGL